MNPRAALYEHMTIPNTQIVFRMYSYLYFNLMFKHSYININYSFNTPKTTDFLQKKILV